MDTATDNTMTLDLFSQKILLEHGWEYAVAAAAQVMTPQECAATALVWQTALVPGTVAAAMRGAGQLDIDHLPPFDQQDYWYRCTCTLPEQAVLHFAGLATHAQVFWNDHLILQSDNMFVAHQVDMHDLPQQGVLSIRFSAVASYLRQRRPRPRWRTRLVEQQQLRWVRSTLLGRLPGWSPAVPPIGPYRAIHVSSRQKVAIENLSLRCHLDQPENSGADTQQSGLNGRVSIRFTLDTTVGIADGAADRAEDRAVFASASGVAEWRFVLQVGEHRQELSTHAVLSMMPAAGEQATAAVITATAATAALVVSGEMVIPQPALWWPHTHGEPTRYDASLTVESPTGSQRIALSPLAFRLVELNQQQGGFSMDINQVSVFCRGACWTPVDLVSLEAPPVTSATSALRATLILARDAGMNMLRVGGTMIYESDAFYALCDELGIMIWQDFMFANMDYPDTDAEFLASTEMEASQFLQRVQSRACLVVLCGNSEVAQQSAMTGMPQECWNNTWFNARLPALCQHYRPDVVYWCSSPFGGSLPFQVDSGVSHYYGLGAYLRPLEDARRAGVRFTTECLGFANVPDEATIVALLPGAESPLHHPRWKQRVPRDGGAGWDFDDVRDHYMSLFFNVDALRLRYSDMERYLALARVSSGMVMEYALAEWRRAGSSCHGALIWFLRDLWPGAGWGLIDALGRPKAAYYQVKRAMAARAVFLTDEGLNGLALHVVNDMPDPLIGRLELTLYRHGEIPVASASMEVNVAGHACIEVRADALFTHFTDTSYAYRFGPPGHDVAVARLLLPPQLPTQLSQLPQLTQLYKDESVMLLQQQERTQEPTLEPTLEQTQEQIQEPIQEQCVVVSDAYHFPLGPTSGQEQDLGLVAESGSLPDGRRLLTLTSKKLALSVAISVPGFTPSDNYLHLAPGKPRTLFLLPNGEAARGQGQVFPLNAMAATKITVRA